MIIINYILKNHAAPFAFSLITLTFVLLFQFLMKFADRLVGKGLDTIVIIQLVTYNLAWMVVLVVPMAVLVATLMAFGTMSQNNEITIMKSTGISLYKMMLSPLIASVVITYLLVEFNNNVLPDANHKAKILMQDISRKKPTLSLEPNVFSKEVSGYAILAREVDSKTNLIKEVTIYDYKDPRQITILTARTGKIYFSENQSKLFMDLYSGEIHQKNPENKNDYRKIIFQKHRIAMEADQFSFNQSAPGAPRGDRELSASDMIVIVDSLEKIRDHFFADLKASIYKHFIADSLAIKIPYFEPMFKNYSEYQVNPSLVERVRNVKNAILSNMVRVNYMQTQINEYMVEVHKKYSIPFACIVFILLGAPLGVMTKKGGFGMAASISIFFFLIYWAALIGGEKLADRVVISPFWGMWSANIVMLLVGMILTSRVAKESITLDLSVFKKLIPKKFLSND